MTRCAIVPRIESDSFSGIRKGQKPFEDRCRCTTTNVPRRCFKIAKGKPSILDKIVRSFPSFDLVFLRIDVYRISLFFYFKLF